MFSELSAEDAAKMTKLNHRKIEALHVLNEEKDLSHRYADYFGVVIANSSITGYLACLRN